MNLWCDSSRPLDDPGQYRRLIEKLIYLTITRPDITFTVGILSRLYISLEKFIGQLL